MYCFIPWLNIQHLVASVPSIYKPVFFNYLWKISKITTYLAIEIINQVWYWHRLQSYRVRVTNYRGARGRGAFQEAAPASYNNVNSQPATSYRRISTEQILWCCPRWFKMLWHWIPTSHCWRASLIQPAIFCYRKGNSVSLWCF